METKNKLSAKELDNEKSNSFHLLGVVLTNSPKKFTPIEDSHKRPTYDFKKEYAEKNLSIGIENFEKDSSEAFSHGRQTIPEFTLDENIKVCVQNSFKSEEKDTLFPTSLDNCLLNNFELKTHEAQTLGEEKKIDHQNKTYSAFEIKDLPCYRQVTTPNENSKTELLNFKCNTNLEKVATYKNNPKLDTPISSNEPKNNTSNNFDKKQIKIDRNFDKRSQQKLLDCGKNKLIKQKAEPKINYISLKSDEGNKAENPKASCIDIQKNVHEIHLDIKNHSKIKKPNICSNDALDCHEKNDNSTNFTKVNTFVHNPKFNKNIHTPLLTPLDVTSSENLGNFLTKGYIKKSNECDVKLKTCPPTINSLENNTEMKRIKIKRNSFSTDENNFCPSSQLGVGYNSNSNKNDSFETFIEQSNKSKRNAEPLKYITDFSPPPKRKKRSYEHKPSNDSSFILASTTHNVKKEHKVVMDSIRDKVVTTIKKKQKDIKSRPDRISTDKNNLCPSSQMRVDDHSNSDKKYSFETFIEQSNKSKRNDEPLNHINDFSPPPKRKKISFEHKSTNASSSILASTNHDVKKDLKVGIDFIRDRVVTSVRKKEKDIKSRIDRISSGIEKRTSLLKQFTFHLKKIHTNPLCIENLLSKYYEQSISFESYNENDLNYDYIELFSKVDALKIYTYLEEEIEYFPEHLQKVCINGNWHNIPRKQVAFGDDGLTYSFSGITLPAKPWTPLLTAIKDLVCHVTGAKFNFVLLNRYKDGDDRIGEHQDDESDLDLRAPIGSLSFGAQRDFVFRHKDAKFHGADIDRVTILLKAGSLLVMKPPTNEVWYHSLPPRKHVFTPRINLTFRVMRICSSSSSSI